ncbi:MAG: FGGY-family carbohydrate kinase [Desulfurococcales archaeon]|nr:FGGY-family carbohydrate kinase [Desulfurococcales archaeon]
MPEYFIGLDLGTGALKTVLIDDEYNLIALAQRKLSIYLPKPGWAEQDPDEWWYKIYDSVREVVSRARINPEDVKAISFSTQMIGVIPVDRDGNPLRKAIIWLDNRAEEEAEDILTEFGVEELIDHVGGLPSGKDAVCKILWLKRNEPEIYEHAYKILDVKDFLVYKMTGEFVTDYTCASVRGNFDMAKKTWSELIAEKLDLPIDKYPEIKSSLEPVGYLTSYAADRMGLTTKTLVVNGAGDVPAAAVGAGATRVGDPHLYIGSSAWVAATVDRRIMDPEHGMGSIVFVDPYKWLFIAEMESAGEDYKWLAGTLMDKEKEEAEKKGISVYEIMDKLAEKAEPGSKNLIFLPWMYGERAPIPDIYVRGAFINLSLDHRKEHIIRAVLEGIAYNIRWITDIVEEDIGKKIRYLPSLGGLLLGDICGQILADVTRRTIGCVKDKLGAVGKGAAAMAMIGYGRLKRIEDVHELVSVDKEFTPIEENSRIYDELYSVFKDLYERLADVYSTLNG